MVRLIGSGSPDVVCLQEVPVWALSHLAPWSEMTAIGDVARRPLPFTEQLGRILETYDANIFRSVVTGQANAVLVHRDLRVVDHQVVVLNPCRFRRAQARRLGLPLAARVHWARERRICQALRIGRADATFVVGNLHATGYADRRLADAELLRAAVFLDGLASPNEPVLMCGDFNVTLRASRTLAELMTPEWGFSGARMNGIDHILVRGLRAGDPYVWPDERRRQDGALLSDHAPVETEVG
jgi:endonuclease/exonuclease/phosphatase family metal-dependent hydrolase